MKGKGGNGFYEREIWGSDYSNGISYVFVLAVLFLLDVTWAKNVEIDG